MIIELMAAANDVLEVVARKRKAERFAKQFGEVTVCRIEVGTVLITKQQYDYLNELGVWAALEEGAKQHAELRKLRMV